MASFLRDTSVASSRTAGRTPSDRFATPVAGATNGYEDVLMTDAHENGARKRRFIVAIDYGTTNSSASFAIINQGQRELLREQIMTIGNFPNDPLRRLRVGNEFRKSNEVASEVWYPDELVINDDVFEYYSRTAHAGEEPDRNLGDFNTEDLASGAQGNGGQTSGTQTNRAHANWHANESTGGDADGDKSGDDPEEPVQEEPVRELYWRDVPACIRWGFEASPFSLQSNPGSLSRRNTPIKWAKLQLASDRKLKGEYWKKTRDTLNSLRYWKRKIVRKELDFITDFLICFFRHVKLQLQLLDEGALREDDDVEIVMCVPVNWSTRASRLMESAMSVAMRSSRLGTTATGTVEKIYDLTEAEAAAAYVLAEDYGIRPGNTIVLLDAGGGTVDAITYEVSNIEPLRFTSLKEAVQPEARLCGSTFLNEKFRKYIKARLRGEKQITDEIIESDIMKPFEDYVKRDMEFEDPLNEKTAEPLANYAFDVRPLRENRAKGFGNNRLFVSGCDFKKDVFWPKMNEVSALMESQIVECIYKNISVDKVVLIGGYGENKALRAFLAERLRRNFGAPILLKTAPEYGGSATAVSKGAVLRAFNKEDGPSRKLQSNFGLKRKEIFDPKLDGHLKASAPKREKDNLDGEIYVRDIIEWKLFKGHDLGTKPKRAVITQEHLFREKQKVCEVREEFFVSDDDEPASHWQVNSPKNRKADFAGTFVLDLTPYRDQGLMERRRPDPESDGEEHWAIEFDVVMEVFGRSIRCWAQYPSTDDGKREVDAHEIPDSHIQWTIAAAFEPGTK